MHDSSGLGLGLVGLLQDGVHGGVVGVAHECLCLRKKTRAGVCVCVCTCRGWGGALPRRVRLINKVGSRLGMGVTMGTTTPPPTTNKAQNVPGSFGHQTKGSLQDQGASFGLPAPRCVLCVHVDRRTYNLQAGQ